MPRHAIAACLEIGRIGLKDIDLVAFYEKPFIKFERLLETYAALAPQGFTSFRRAVPLWIKEKLFQKDALIRELKTLDPDDGRCRRMDHHVARARPGREPRDSPGDPLPAFDRPALLRLHLLHRLQGELRRVQGDGPRALWHTAVRANHPRSPHRPEARRNVPAGSALFQLLHRPDHDERALRCAVRRAAAQPGKPSHAARHGPCRVDPGGDRRSRDAARAQHPRRDRGPQSLPGRRRGAELRRQRQDSGGKAVRPHLDPAGGRRCRRRTGCGARGLSPAGGRRARAAYGTRRHAGGAAGQFICTVRHRSAPDRRRCAVLGSE